MFLCFFDLYNVYYLPQSSQPCLDVDGICPEGHMPHWVAPKPVMPGSTECWPGGQGLQPVNEWVAPS